MEDAPKYGPLLTRQDVHELCARVRELLRECNELQEEVAHLRETLGMFAALRDLMHDDSPSLAHVASNGHIVHRSPDAAGEGATTLQVMADNPNDGLDDGRHDGLDNEDFDRTAPDEDAGDVSSVETSAAAIPHADDPPDHPIPAGTVEAGEEASAISAPTPTEHDALVSSGVPRPAPRLPAPDNAMAPVEAASTDAPSPPVEVGGKAPLLETLRHGFSLASPEARTQKTVASAKRAGINPLTHGGVAPARDTRVSRERARGLLGHAGARSRRSIFARREQALAPVHAYTHQGERLCRPFTHAI